MEFEAKRMSVYDPCLTCRVDISTNPLLFKFDETFPREREAGASAVYMVSRHEMPRGSMCGNIAALNN